MRDIKANPAIRRDFFDPHPRSAFTTIWVSLSGEVENLATRSKTSLWKFPSGLRGKTEPLLEKNEINTGFILKQRFVHGASVGAFEEILMRTKESLKLTINLELYQISIG